ncbi:hypothetical protein [Engelhardtia mirabilis]|uniref:Chromosome partition protein Smc n=1 Tax=Engelhardtia mirabilis TaxID=2528011 RepID=A0A518BLY6_9BACT|nr:hypothetical protein Pla133_30820 [Planctomycetes bacterium Pla133]QDV02317.1 hypothetical protein Pla86_30810 [Planctomycetes bacterium Pla86]
MLRSILLPSLALFALPALHGCATPLAASDSDASQHSAIATDAPDGDDDEKEDEDDAEKKAHKLAREIAGMEWKLEQAQLDRTATEIDVALDLGQAEQAVVDAGVAVEEAALALQTFTQVESAHELDSSKLDLDRSQTRAVQAAQELAELQSMYDVEEFAEKTKELVISRGQTNLEMAQRSLDLQQRSHALLSDFELPKKTRALQREVDEAKRKLKRAERQLEKARIEAEKRRRSAAHEIEELELDLAEKRAEVEA